VQVDTAYLGPCSGVEMDLTVGQEIAALVSLIVAINAWNAISVSTRAWAPGSYQP
jgi:hypothetical protein